MVLTAILALTVIAGPVFAMGGGGSSGGGSSGGSSGGASSGGGSSSGGSSKGGGKAEQILKKCRARSATSGTINASSYLTEFFPMRNSISKALSWRRQVSMSGL